jgi:CRP-like cAMP-binding protein
MPRFFFNIRNGNGFTPDEEGREFADGAAARAEAVKGVRSMLAEEAKSGRIDLAGRIEVTDESGGPVAAVAFRDAVQLGTAAPTRPRSGEPVLGEIFEQHLGLIGELSPEDVEALYTIEGEIRDVARGEDLLREGDRPSTSVVVISGLLQRYSISAAGKRQIHSFYIPTDTPCLETLHIDFMDNNLAAAAPSRVGIVPHSELLRVMEERPKLQALIWRETLVQAAVFRKWLIRNSQMLAHAQLAHLFCEMLTRAEAAGLAKDGGMDLPVTQEDLADALGMTSVHVNRTLALLRSGGLADFRGGRLTAMDREGLWEAAEFDPYYLHLRR